MPSGGYVAAVMVETGGAAHLGLRNTSTRAMIRQASVIDIAERACSRCGIWRQAPEGRRPRRKAQRLRLLVARDLLCQGSVKGLC